MMLKIRSIHVTYLEGIDDMRKDFQTINAEACYFVTGGAGFIGFHLSKRLLELGCQVIGFDNLNDYYDVQLKHDRLAVLKAYPKYTFIKGDLANAKEVEQVFMTYHPQYVIHLGAQAGVRYSLTNPQAYLESNLIGFYNMIENCRHFLPKHFVYASSSSVYGHNTKTPYSTEDKTDSPVSLYAATKKSNELMAYAYSHLYHIPSTGLRFFTVYGPYGRPDMAYFSFTQKILKGEPISVFNEGHMFRDFTYVDDIVEGIIHVIPNAPLPNAHGVQHKVYNIGNHQCEELSRFISVLEKTIGYKAQIQYKPMQPGDVLKTYADVRDLMEDFDFKPSTSIEEGLAKFWAWYQDYYHVEKKKGCVNENE